LSARGLVTRRADPLDRRARQLHLTDAGEELQQQAYEAARAHEEGWLQHLDKAERAQLIALLLKIRHGADND